MFCKRQLERNRKRSDTVLKRMFGKQNCERRVAVNNRESCQRGRGRGESNSMTTVNNAYATKFIPHA